nr:universal stress protein [Methanobacterium formicicum]
MNKQEGNNMFNTIMVPTDGSEYSQKAEDTALALAKKTGFHCGCCSHNR